MKKETLAIAAVVTIGVVAIAGVVVIVLRAAWDVGARIKAECEISWQQIASIDRAKSEQDHSEWLRTCIDNHVSRVRR